MTNATLPVQSPRDTHNPAPFVARHIGPGPEEARQMLSLLGYSHLEELMQAVGRPVFG
jgi:glycine cleavage system pyridoxal-binding protein P